MSEFKVGTRSKFTTPTVHWVIIAGCVLVGFLDMLLLSSAIERMLDTDQATASLLAFCLAIVGTLTAFLWGRSEALHKGRMAWAHHEPWIWLLICILFIAIRAVVITMDLKEFPDEIFSTISSEALMAVVLTVLYVGSGLIVRAESKSIFDPERYTEWHKMRAAKRVQHSIAKKYAEAERMIIELEKFQKYYTSLDKQYLIRKNALIDAERTTLSTVVKRVLEDNTHLSPQVVDDILQSIIADRKNRILE